MDEDESRSASNVPDFIRPHLFTEIIPTVLEFYGAKLDPWNSQEYGRNELLDLCKELINDVCPRADYTLTKSDIIYKVVRHPKLQCVLTTRQSFVSTDSTGGLIVALPVSERRRIRH